MGFDSPGPIRCPMPDNTCRRRRAIRASRQQQKCQNRRGRLRITGNAVAMLNLARRHLQSLSVLSVGNRSSRRRERLGRSFSATGPAVIGLPIGWGAIKIRASVSCRSASPLPPVDSELGCSTERLRPGLLSGSFDDRFDPSSGRGLGRYSVRPPCHEQVASDECIASQKVWTCPSQVSLNRQSMPVRPSARWRLWAPITLA